MNEGQLPPFTECDFMPVSDDSAELEQINSEAEQLLEQLKQQINAAISAAHDDANSLIESLAAQVSGTIGVCQDECCGTLTKCYGKVVTSISNTMGQAFGYLRLIQLPMLVPYADAPGYTGPPVIAMPIPFPTGAQVIYGNTTGDYLGSIGIVDPSYPDAMEQIEVTLNGQPLEPAGGGNQAGDDQAGDDQPDDDQAGDDQASGEEDSGSAAGTPGRNGSAPPGSLYPGRGEPIKVKVRVEVPDATETPALGVLESCPPKPVTPCFGRDDQGMLYVPPEWCAYLGSVDKDTLAYACLTVTEQAAWDFVDAGDVCTAADDQEEEDQAEEEEEEEEEAGPNPIDFTVPFLPQFGDLSEACEAIATFLGAFAPEKGPLSQQLGFSVNGNGDVDGPEWFERLFPLSRANAPVINTICDVLDFFVTSSPFTSQKRGEFAGACSDQVIRGGARFVRNLIGKPIIATLDGINWAVKQAPVGLGAKLAATLALNLIDAPFALLEKWTGIKCSKTRDPIERMLNLMQPTGLLDIESYNTLLREGKINKETYKCMIGALNQDIDPVDQLREIHRIRLDISELITLWQRGQLDLPFVDDEMRRLGAINAAERFQIRLLAQHWPDAFSALDSFVKGVFNPDVVEGNGLDDGRDEFAGSPAATAAKGNGYTDEQIVRLWQSHWKLPRWQEVLNLYWRSEAGTLPPDDDIVLDDVKSALTRDGIPPLWHDDMIAGATPILEMRQLRLGYQNGEIPRSMLESSLQSHGWSGETLSDLMDTLDRARLLAAGGHTPKEVVALYETYAINATDFKREMDDLGFSDNDQFKLGTDAETRREAKLRVEQIAVVKKRYMDFSLEEIEILGLLSSLRLDARQQTELRNQWIFERSLKSKELSGGALCKYFNDGLITADDYYLRLVKAGYTTTDAKLIVEDCGKLPSAPAQKKAKAAEKEKIAKHKAAEKKKKAEAKCKLPPKPKCKPGEKP